MSAACGDLSLGLVCPQARSQEPVTVIAGFALVMRSRDSLSTWQLGPPRELGYYLAIPYQLKGAEKPRAWLPWNKDHTLQDFIIGELSDHLTLKIGHRQC